MTKVEIYKLNNDGSQKVIATCELANNEIIFNGDDTLTGNIEREGIYEYVNGERTDKKLFPKNGLKFLENLKHNFRSAYLSASDLQD